LENTLFRSGAYEEASVGERQASMLMTRQNSTVGPFGPTFPQVLLLVVTTPFAYRNGQFLLGFYCRFRFWVSISEKIVTRKMMRQFSR